MKYLLDEQLAPLTFRWAFFESSLDEIVTHFQSWREGYGRKIALERCRGNLPELLSKLTPLTMPRSKELFVKTTSNWTAYFDNSRIGGDIFTPTPYITRTTGLRGIAVSAVRDTSRLAGNGKTGFAYGGVQMRVFENRSCPRSIAAINDGGKWVFHARGEVQLWEQPERYAARRIAERFTSDMLEKYCRHFGLEIFDHGFYGPDAVLMSSDEPIVMTIALAEQRRLFGLEA